MTLGISFVKYPLTKKFNPIFLCFDGKIPLDSFMPYIAEKCMDLI